MKMRLLPMTLALVATISASSEQEPKHVIPFASASERLEFLSYVVALVDENATAFLVRADKRSFVITAKHVAAHTPPPRYLTLRSAEGTALRLALTELINEGTSWRMHEKADVAALLLRDGAPELLGSRFIEISAIQKAAPKSSTPLLVIGYPLPSGLELSAQSKFSPIWRETRVASELLTLTGLPGGSAQEVFILQDPSVGGFSGSPVLDLGASDQASTVGGFQTQWGPVECWGVVSGTMSDNTGGKFAIVVPGSRLHELLGAAE